MDDPTQFGRLLHEVLDLVDAFVETITDAEIEEKLTRMIMSFFGERWDAPIVERATQLPTPVGRPCLVCSEPIVEGDRGFLRVTVRVAADGRPDARVEPVHAECDMLGVMGHQLGVCRCSGFDTTARASALELLARVNAGRASRGRGAL